MDERGNAVVTYCHASSVLIELVESASSHVGGKKKKERRKSCIQDLPAN